MKIFIATSNQGKLREFKEALNSYEFFSIQEIISVTHQPFEEVKEDQDTFIGNASQKWLYAKEYIQKNREILCLHDLYPDIIIVDDSGLCVPKLQYAPGVHSAYYGGLPRSSQKNIHALQEKIASFQVESLEAFFIACLIADSPENSSFSFSQEEEMKILESIHQSPMFLGSLLTQRENPFISYGFCKGKVSIKEQNLLEGEGHGYDPLFYPSLTPQKSFGSIPLSLKNSISHRGMILTSLKQFLFSYMS